MAPVTTLIADDSAAATIREALDSLGFVFGRPRPIVRTRLDTFDGRVHRADLRLEVHQSDELSLHLLGAGVVPVAVPISRPPGQAQDLHAGPLRNRLYAITRERALLRSLSMRATATDAVRRDRRDKVVAEATLFEGIRLDPPGSRTPPRCIVELTTVPGYERHTRTAIEALGKLGLEVTAVDALGALGARAAIDLAGVDSEPAVALRADADATAAVARVLENLAGVVHAHWQGVIDEIDTEFLHEFRVAVRRSRSVLKHAASVLPEPLHREGRTLLGALASATGPARDLDVELSDWHGLPTLLGIDAVTELEPLHQLVQQRSRDAHRDLAAVLRDPVVVTAFAAWQHDLGALGARTTASGEPTPIGPMVGERIVKAHRRLVTRGRRIDDTSPVHQLHDLRKDAKALRYLVECFATVLDDAPRRRYLRRLKALQEVLGLHQDADVQRDELAVRATQLHAAGAGPGTLLAIGRLDAILGTRRDRARGEFAAHFTEFDAAATRAALTTMLRPAVR